MPSLLHESLTELFRDDPGLAPRLLRELWGLPVPEGPIETPEARLREIAPIEYHADLVLLIRAEAPVAIIVEVQLQRDPDKQAAWLAYLAMVHRTLKALVLLLVVTPSEAVERWANAAYTIGHPGLSLAPLVLGPSNTPIIVDPRAPGVSPQLALLSALAHGRGPHASEVALAAALASADLDSATRRVYVGLILDHISDVARVALEKLMLNNPSLIKELDAVLARFVLKVERTRARQEGVEKGRAQGERKGRKEGRKEGQKLGEQEGALQARRELLQRVLASRGIALDEAWRERVAGCKDAAQLDRWFNRALTAESLGDLES